MDTDKIKQALTRQIKSCTANDATRAELFQRFMGEPYGNEKSFRSSYVDTTVRDVVMTVHTEVMDILLSGDNPIEFTPVAADDEEAAEQETDVVNHVLMQQNHGETLLSSWVLEGLVEQVSYVSSGWEEKEEVRIDTYRDLSVDELTQIAMEYGQSGEDYKVVETEQTDEGKANVTIRCVKKVQKYKVDHFPQSEFRLAGGWPSISLDGCPFTGRVRKDWNMSDLLAMGFSKESIEKLSDKTDDIGQQSRNNTRNHQEEDDERDNLQVGEFYIRTQVDKGPASMFQVWASHDGAHILEWEDGKPAITEVDDHPFSALTPFLVYHRHAGQSVAEIVKDIADVKTVVRRMELDNLYSTQYARPVIGAVSGPDLTTLFKDLQNPRQGAPIRAGNSVDNLRWDMPPSIIGTTSAIYEQQTMLQEMRTGATRYNQGLEADSLNKTATGVKRIMAASQKRILAIARNIKATGLSSLYLKIHRDLRRGPGREMTLRLRGKWTPIDPRQWRARDDITVSVTSDKDIKAQGLQIAAMLQEKLLASGVPEFARMVGPDKVHNLVSKTLGEYGYRSADQFFGDPAQMPPMPPPPPPPPDPMMFSAETERMKAQNDHDYRMRQLDIQLLELHVKEAEIVGKFENAAEANDIKRDAAAAQDDRERERAALATAQAIDASEQARIRAIDPNPEIAE